MHRFLSIPSRAAEVPTTMTTNAHADYTKRCYAVLLVATPPKKRSDYRLITCECSVGGETENRSGKCSGLFCRFVLIRSVSHLTLHSKAE